MCQMINYAVTNINSAEAQTTAGNNNRFNGTTNYVAHKRGNIVVRKTQ